MSNSNHSVLSVIVCDDVRTEINGKQSAFGLYDNEMVVSVFPTVIAKLCFRVTVHLLKRQPKTLKFSVTTGNNNLFEYDGPFPKILNPTSSGNNALVFVASPAMVPSADRYLMKLGIDGPPKQIGDFTFRLAKGSVEKARLVS